jgi:hypothetical protein
MLSGPYPIWLRKTDDLGYNPALHLTNCVASLLLPSPVRTIEAQFGKRSRRADHSQVNSQLCGGASPRPK